MLVLEDILWVGEWKDQYTVLTGKWYNYII